MSTNIFLQGFNSKKSVNTSEGLNVTLMGNRKLLPNSDINETVNLYDVYTAERKKCNKIRLTCQVNTVCTNVLYNSVTEIVKDEGSSGLSFLNYGVISGDVVDDTHAVVDGDLYFKTKEVGFWKNQNVYQAIRDTQLSSRGFVYHCGADIMNNHLIRSNTFKVVCAKADAVIDEDNEKFNTIEDWMRDVNGESVFDRVYYPLSSGLSNTKGGRPIRLHMYKADDLYTYDECLKNRLITTFEGWVGFRNKPRIKTYMNYGKNNEECLNIERPIMYLNGGDFVDMYPDRSLYSFVPKYNKFRNRIEKNWNYCLTYPSSSYTPSETDEKMEFTDIIEPTNGALKAIYFNENTMADNGTKQLVIYSVAKHGLSIGDVVNIYSTNKVTSGDNTVNVSELILENVKVTAIASEYIFTVSSTKQLSKYWVELTDEEYHTDYLTLSLHLDQDNPSATTELTLYNHKYFSEGISSSEKYYLIDGTRYVNFDKNAQNISYKKVVGGIECDYYIRIFSRLPNFKHASGDTSSEYEIYKRQDDGTTMLETYQTNEYDFDSHVSRLAFAKNAYSDNIGEIVYTDDIDLSNLKDNLGRPLTSIYLTIVKNNAGYKEWYGFDVNMFGDWNESEIKKSNVEFSHCFGSVTCGLETSIEARYDEFVKSINKINPLSGAIGYDIDLINGDRDDYLWDDKNYDINPTEVWFDLDRHYYGDLCYYDNYNAIERSIQPILHRFNTAQRESMNSKSDLYFQDLYYDVLKHDDYDYADFDIDKIRKMHCNEKREGYYYQPHHEIKLRTFDKLETIMPDFLTITKINPLGESVNFTSLEHHNLTMGDKAIVYDRVANKYYTCSVTSGITDNSKKFTCKIYDENNNLLNATSLFKDENDMVRPCIEFNVFKMDNVPNGARILKDGTCRIIWRNVLNNGFDITDKSVDEYPFTNGAFYVNKCVNLYVKRQDPYNYWGLYSSDDAVGAPVNNDKEDNYVKADDIEC